MQVAIVFVYMPCGEVKMCTERLLQWFGSFSRIAACVNANSESDCLDPRGFNFSQLTSCWEIKIESLE
jgi:hypothetical protein